MKKITVLIFISFILSKSYGQLTKGNWLVGGYARFTKQKQKLLNSDVNSFVANISPNVGYFFADKFAAGVRPGVGFFRSNSRGVIQKSTTLGVGPFVRYYFLSVENRTNLFAESSYRYVTDFNGFRENTFTISAGPAIFFNSSVGLELTLNYELFRSNAATSLARTFFLNIGFQIHLEKETNL